MSVKGIIQAAFWRTRFTETVKISAIARSEESAYPARHWADLERAKYEIKRKIILMNVKA